MTPQPDVCEICDVCCLVADLRCKTVRLLPWRRAAHVTHVILCTLVEWGLPVLVPTSHWMCCVVVQVSGCCVVACDAHSCELLPLHRDATHADPL